MKLPIQPSRFPAFVLALLLTVGAGALLTGCGGEHGSGNQAGEEQLYTCGMHPQIIQNKPGNCPVCGMKLTPVRKQGAKAAAPPGEGKLAGESESNLITVDPITIQNMNLHTATVTRGPLRRLVRTVGAIEYNEATLAEVTTKFKGWVEKLNVDTTGQLVMKGDPLFEIYSPELYSAQREYLLALEGTNTPGGDALKASARTKLKFFDISDEQIADLERTREPRKTLRVVSPQDGFVVEKTVVEGQMAEAGTKLYRLADLGLVWVQAQIYEQDLDYVKLGQEATVTLSYLPDREFRGRVTYIYPNVDEKTRTARVRMEFHNPGYFLKPGMFATVQVLSELAPSVLLVPNMAILRSGEKNTVFVALEGGNFEPRAVTLGLQAENDTYQVTSGLNEGDRVVTSGQFLLDSESQLRDAIQKMSRSKSTVAAAAESREGHQTTGTTNAEAATTQDTAVKYICPMPEHVSIEYDHPGKCPLCGMVLVPVTSATLAKLQPGGKLLYYTCPMPEHADVHSDKPGKCPKCGMTLIPIMQVAPLTNAPPSRADALQSTLNSQLSTTLYTCQMASHDIVSDKPGKCPKCEMDLVPTSTVPHGKIAEENWLKQHAARER